MLILFRGAFRKLHINGKILHYYAFHSRLEFNRGNAAIAVEGEQNAVDHCGNDGNFLPYGAIFDTIQMIMFIKSCVNHY
jgi:hypothetical protein